MSDKLQEEIERGSRAQILLRNEVYQEAVGKVRQGIMDAWAESPLRDTEGQHELRLMLKLLTDIEKNIERVATTGTLALRQIEHERSLKERAAEAAKGLISRFT